MADSTVKFSRPTWLHYNTTAGGQKRHHSAKKIKTSIFRKPTEVGFFFLAGAAGQRLQIAAATIAPPARWRHLDLLCCPAFRRAITAACGLPGFPSAFSSPEFLQNSVDFRPLYYYTGPRGRKESKFRPWYQIGTNLRLSQFDPCGQTCQKGGISPLWTPPYCREGFPLPNPPVPAAQEKMRCAAEL